MTQAVAVREDQHPIIQKIDDRMPEIAEMLPEGMNPDRFRRVVVQALVRNPDLWACTPVSVVSAIVESAQIGLEPTGVLGRAWMLPYSTKQPNGSYRKEAKLIVGYRGYAELAWRADRILVTTGAVRQGDEFSYQRGTGKYLRHVPILDDSEHEADDGNITHFWAMYTLPDGREDFDVMSRKAAERIRERAKKKNPVWDSDFGEMGRKTVLRRLLKVAPLSPEVQRVLARDEEVDFDTPVERVPDPRREGLRDRITQRTAALRGSASEESDASGLADAPADGAEEAGSSAPASGSSPRGGDPWMRRLHAVAAERGMDHDDLHQWAVQHFRVDSLTDLIPGQRATFMELVEGMPLMPQPEAGVPTSSGLEAGEARAPASDNAAEERPDPSDAATDPAVASPPAAGSGTPSIEDVLAVTGGELVPPDYDADPDAYKAWYDALPSSERALLRGKGRSPRQMADAAKAAAKGPDTEQMRAALEGES